jgi:hypothetical protein
MILDFVFVFTTAITGPGTFMQLSSETYLNRKHCMTNRAVALATREKLKIEAPQLTVTISDCIAVDMQVKND